MRAEVRTDAAIDLAGPKPASAAAAFPSDAGPARRVAEEFVTGGLLPLTMAFGACEVCSAVPRTMLRAASNHSPCKGHRLQHIY
ncbi:hypothetical protein RJ55_04850 [Drechmeria coniospora]|nr:hypothetical protein RJ55_04850 [Drechmeria coniospora]